MAFFEGLKKIIPAKIAESLFDYDLKLSNAPVNPSNDCCFEIDKHNKLLILYLDKLSYKEKSILEKHLKSSFEKNQIKFIESEKLDLVERLLCYNKGNTDESTLLFFQSILSTPDLNALREALFLRNEFFNGREISFLKKDIAFTYGERGNIISNLCSAGYFEEIMIPLYKISEKEFYTFYDLAVDRGVKALFVSSQMTVTKIVQEIERRLVSAKSSGLKSINIHGIGSKNVKNIKTSLSKLKQNDRVHFLDKRIYEKDNVIIVELIISK